MFSYVQQMPENHHDFHRVQQLLEQQLQSQNGLIIDPEAAKILKIVLDEEFGGIDNFLKGEFTIKSPSYFGPGEEIFRRLNSKENISFQQIIDYFEEIVDRTLLETNAKLSKEGRASLIQVLLTQASKNGLINETVAFLSDSPAIEEQAAIMVEISTSYFPPEIEIINISPQEFSTIQKEFIKDRMYDFGSEDLIITDRLPLSVVSVGNARIIDLEDFSNLCITSFGEKYRETSSNEWMQLRKSTCPYSILSDSERELIQDNIKKIVTFAASMGLVIVIAYLVIEVEKIKHKKFQSINTAGGDVVLENGYLDKREGAFVYITISGMREQGIEEVKNAYIQIDKPNGKLFKPITIVLDPENKNKIFAFPNLLDYVADNAIDIENTEFGADKKDDCRAAPLLSHSENQIVAGKKLIGLLDDKNEEVRSISADALGEIKAENAIQGLGEHLKKERSEKVINNILSSLLSIGTDAATQYVFEYAANHNMSELLTNWCTQKVNTQSLLVLFRAATEHPTSSSAQSILSKINYHNIDLEPILNEFSSSTINIIKLNIASFLVLILEKSFDNNTHKKISSALATSMIEDKKDVAIEISEKIGAVKNLNSGDNDALLKSLDSPYDEVRINIVKKLGDALKK